MYAVIDRIVHLLWLPTSLLPDGPQDFKTDIVALTDLPPEYPILAYYLEISLMTCKASVSDLQL